MYCKLNLKITILITLLFTTLSLAQETRPEHHELVKKMIQAVNSKDVTKYKSLIHPKCPVDDSKIKSALSDKWTTDYKITIKTVASSFDLSKINFAVKPEEAMEIHLATRVSDPHIIKALNGKTTIDSIKVFALARHKKQLKIIDWPCFEPIEVKK